MSRCAHAQSTYRLTKMPTCRKCKQPLYLIAVAAKTKKGYVFEWECTRCNKSIPYHLIQEPEFSEEDRILHEWCKRNNSNLSVNTRNN
jgi:RNase P subunit RPR2